MSFIARYGARILLNQMNADGTGQLVLNLELNDVHPARQAVAKHIFPVKQYIMPTRLQMADINNGDQLSQDIIDF